MASLNRRPHYIVSGFFMALSGATAGAILYVISENPGILKDVIPIISINTSHDKFISDQVEYQLSLQVGLVISILVFFVFYGAGFGCVPYTLVGEVFLPKMKSTGVTLASFSR